MQCRVRFSFTSTPTLQEMLVAQPLEDIKCNLLFLYGCHSSPLSITAASGLHSLFCVYIHQDTESLQFHVPIIVSDSIPPLCTSLCTEPEQAPRKRRLPTKSSLTVCLHCSVFGTWKHSSTNPLVDPNSHLPAWTDALERTEMNLFNLRHSAGQKAKASLLLRHTTFPGIV